MMVGLTRPDHGDVRYHGVSYTQPAAPRPGSSARCSTPVPCTPAARARNHLQAMAALSSIPARRVDEVLHEVGLDTAADQRAGGFSLGMRQRLALAGALLGEPEVLLLDEPSNGLDPDGIRWLRNSLSEFAAHGGTVFVSSHLIGELAMFADDLVVVGGGKLLAAEPVAATLARGETTVVVRTPARRRARPPRSTVSGDHRQRRRRPPHGPRHHADRRCSQIAFDHRIQVVEITEASRSLEEILLDMTGASAEFAAA